MVGVRMNKKEIKDYMERMYDLGIKLTGEDKETYTWLIYGYNQCAKLLNETEEQCKNQKDNWNKLKEYINTEWYSYDNDSVEFEVAKDILDKMEEMIGGDK